MQNENNVLLLKCPNYRESHKRQGDRTEAMRVQPKNGFGLYGFLVFVSFKFYGFTVGQSYVYLGSGSSMQHLFVQKFLCPLFPMVLLQFFTSYKAYFLMLYQAIYFILYIVLTYIVYYIILVNQYKTFT